MSTTSSSALFRLDFLKGCNIELENSNGRITEVTQNATRLEVQIKDLLSEFECINNELKPLPEECFVTMRLVYNKDTPENYNPEGFVTDEKGDMTVLNQGKSLHQSEKNHRALANYAIGKAKSLCLGILFDDEVRSGYHSMKAKLYFDQEMKRKNENSHDTTNGTCTQSSSDQYQSAL